MGTNKKEQNIIQKEHLNNKEHILRQFLVCVRTQMVQSGTKMNPIIGVTYKINLDILYTNNISKLENFMT